MQPRLPPAARSNITIASGNATTTYKNPLEASLLAAPASSIRPGRAGPRGTSAVATAGVQRRRVVKKHIQQKYLLCGFAIHAFLATPAYLYGNVVESDKAMVLRIWPAIVYQATREIMRFITEQMQTEDYHGRPRETTKYRRIFLLATLIICCSLMISGIFFSSAWVSISTTTQTIAIIFYGVFAGIGSGIYIWKTHAILEAVRPREDKFVRKMIHLCGEAFCQLFLSFVFTSLRTLYGTAQSIVLMSAMLVNLIPLSLIITRHREGAITKRISVIKTEVNHPQLHHQLGMYPSVVADQMDGLDCVQMQRGTLGGGYKSGNVYFEQSQTTCTNAATASALMAAAAAVDSHANYILGADESYVTFVNPNGVEIMEIIPEEDENVSVMRSSSATIDNYGRASVNASHQTIHKAPSLQGFEVNGGAVLDRMFRIKRFSHDMTSHIWLNILENLLLPLRHALVMPQLYTTALLLSTDIFSYVMCLTVLPGLAVSYHAIKIAEIPFLYSLLAFPWMCFSLMTPRFGHSLYKHKFQWHSLGCLFKSLALIFISFSTSKLLLSVSSVLLGFGQAISLFLQSWVLQKSMARSIWATVQSPVHFMNGLLILLCGVMAHWVVVKFSFQATVGLAGLLYTFSIILWHCVQSCHRATPI